MNNQKILKIILILVGLLIIIFSGVFVVQALNDLDNLKFSQVKNFLNKEEEKQILEDTDIDTTNWKTYRNEEFGFEFKYPEKFIIYEQKDAYDNKYFLVGTQQSINNNTTQIGIHYFQNIEKLSLNEWFAKYKNEGEGPTPEETMEKLAINNINVIIYTARFSSNFSALLDSIYTNLFWKNEKNNLIFTLTGEFKINETYLLEIFKKIQYSLNSF